MTMKKTILEMTKEDFEQVPRREKIDSPVDIFWSLVIIPNGIKHDSRWCGMDFVTVDSNFYPIMRIGMDSDALFINGIGGYGKVSDIFKDSKRQIVPQSVPVQGWSIDCLPCGYLRLFSNGKLEAGKAAQAFEIFHVPLKPEDYARDGDRTP